jgi:hypothetical protein
MYRISISPHKIYKNAARALYIAQIVNTPRECIARCCKLDIKWTRDTAIDDEERFTTLTTYRNETMIRVVDEITADLQTIMGRSFNVTLYKADSQIHRIEQK